MRPQWVEVVTQRRLESCGEPMQGARTSTRRRNAKTAMGAAEAVGKIARKPWSRFETQSLERYCLFQFAFLEPRNRAIANGAESLDLSQTDRRRGRGV